MAQDIYLGGIAQVKAYRILQATVSDTVKSLGLSSVSEWLILCHIYYGNNVIGADLAVLLDVEAPLVTRLVSHLITANLVKAVPHPTDGRVKMLQATPAAKSLLERTDIILERRLRQLLDGVEPEQLQAYQFVLRQIITNDAG